MDDSFKDSKYFVNNHIYNCPFCNRRHVAYSVIYDQYFHWTDKKSCFLEYKQIAGLEFKKQKL